MKTKNCLIYLMVLYAHLSIGQSLTLLPGNSDEGTLVSRSTKPIITMYGNGSDQGSKMLFSYSPSFLNWGIQYVGTGVNKINFLGGTGVGALTVNLTSKLVGVKNDNPVYPLDVDGTINATSYRINGTLTSPVYYFASNWITAVSSSVDSSVDGTCLKTRRLVVPQLTNDIINGASIQIYFRVGGVGPYQLPYINDAGGHTNQVNYFLKKPGEIIVFRHTFNSCRFTSSDSQTYTGEPVMIGLPQTLEYRYVIIKNL